MGGSGSVNAMVYTRGSAGDWDAFGVDGWGWKDVAPIFDDLEVALDPHRREPTEFTETCIAAAEREGFRRKEDLNDGTLSGYLGYEWMNYAGEERRSSYVALLKPRLGQPNLTVETNARVHRIVFDADRRAVAVEYEQGGVLKRVGVRREVALTAGALESPRLLMLSGVGPAAELRRHGIAPVLEHEGVGANLHDHPNIPTFFYGRRPTDCRYVQLYGFHRAHPGGPLPADEADTCFVFYTARSSLREGMIRMGPGKVLPPRLYEIGWVRRGVRAAITAVASSPPMRYLLGRTWGIIVILGKPLSRGSLTLRSTDPAAPGLVDPAYLSDPHDVDTLVRGVRWARRIAGAEPLATWGSRPVAPPAGLEDQARLERYVRRNLITTYHFAGTCRMGEDEASVVDPRLRLRGLAGVRVADASIIPVAPVSALNAPSMLIGYRAAAMSHAERREEGRAIA